MEKLVRAGYNGTAYATVVTDLKYLYDGWNILYELNALAGNAVVRLNVWGLDLSGTLQGAGGVGGLLATFDYTTSTWYAPIYDAMGNVHGMINASTGNIDAAYEYDAFGNTLRASGSYAAINPVGYSTKYTDLETGLVYYGLRYYSPTLGRFINQDPIAEQGGLNLYAFCSNNGINRWDYLGMDPPGFCASAGCQWWQLGNRGAWDQCLHRLWWWQSRGHYYRRGFKPASLDGASMD